MSTCVFIVVWRGVMCVGLGFWRRAWKARKTQTSGAGKRS